jgi:hypothetical protein
MTFNAMRRVILVAAIGLSVSLAAQANAQCCGQAATAYYQPAAYTAYSPVAYTSYYGNYGGGWYPGYWLNRVRTRLFGAPSTYVASYPTAYQASYVPSYTAAYRPAYSVGYSTSYAAPVAASSGCSSCSSYSAGYAPCSSCTSSYSPCSTCTTCATPAVSQAVYQQPAAGCASCGTQSTVVAPAATAPAPQHTQGPTPAPQSTYGVQNGAPSISPGADVPTERPQDTQRPATNGAEQDIQPVPGSDADEADPYKVDSDSSTYFQAPKLFDPNDRTAQRSIAPVIAAVYEKPVSYRNVSTRPITLEQAERDAAGWVSASQ